MVQIKLKGVIGVESPSPRSFWCRGPRPSLPLEWARVETGGANQRVLKQREFSGFAIVNNLSPTSLDTHYRVSMKTLLSKRERKLLDYYDQISKIPHPCRYIKSSEKYLLRLEQECLEQVSHSNVIWEQ